MVPLVWCKIQYHKCLKCKDIPFCLQKIVRNMQHFRTISISKRDRTNGTTVCAPKMVVNLENESSFWACPYDCESTGALRGRPVGMSRLVKVSASLSSKSRSLHYQATSHIYVIMKSSREAAIFSKHIYIHTFSSGACLDKDEKALCSHKYRKWFIIIYTIL